MIRDRIQGALRRLQRAPEAPPAPAPPAFERAALEAILDAYVRPALHEDGGDIEVVGIVGGNVHVRMRGACDGCPSQAMTLGGGVDRLLREELPGFEGLVVL